MATTIGEGAQGARPVAQQDHRPAYRVEGHVVAWGREFVPAPDEEPMAAVDVLHLHLKKAVGAVAPARQRTRLEERLEGAGAAVRRAAPARARLVLRRAVPLMAAEVSQSPLSATSPVWSAPEGSGALGASIQAATSFHTVFAARSRSSMW